MRASLSGTDFFFPRGFWHSRFALREEFPAGLPFPPFPLPLLWGELFLPRDCLRFWRTTPPRSPAYIININSAPTSLLFFARSLWVSKYQADPAFSIGSFVSLVRRQPRLEFQTSTPFRGPGAAWWRPPSVEGQPRNLHLSWPSVTL